MSESDAASVRARRIDPSVWNLGGAVVLAVVAGGSTLACGPVIPLDDTDTGPGTGDADTNATSPDDDGTPDTTSPGTTSPATTSPGTTTTPVECVDDDDCPPAYRCDAGLCVYEGCPDGCCDEECCDTDCAPPLCSIAADCEPGEACRYNVCEPLPVEDPCEPLPFALGFDLPIPGGSVSLAFVDADGDAAHELLVGGAGVGLADLDGAFETIDPDSLPYDLVVGDLDADGDDDVVMLDAQTGSPRVLTNDGVWTPTPLPAVGGMVDVVLADLFGTGLPDIVATGPDGTWVWRSEGGEVWNEVAFVWDVGLSLAAGRLDGDEFEDLALFGGSTYALFGSGASNAIELFNGTTGGSRSVVVGDLDGMLDPDVLSIESSGVGSVATTWLGPVLGAGFVSTWWPYAVDVAIAADVDQDGFVDVVGGGTSLVVARGGPPPDGIQCVVDVETPITPIQIAVGDMSGDGRPDLAVADFNLVHVLLRTD